MYLSKAKKNEIYRQRVREKILALPPGTEFTVDSLPRPDVSDLGFSLGWSPSAALSMGHTIAHVAASCGATRTGEKRGGCLVWRTAPCA